MDKHRIAYSPKILQVLSKCKGQGGNSTIFLSLDFDQLLSYLFQSTSIGDGIQKGTKVGQY